MQASSFHIDRLDGSASNPHSHTLSFSNKRSRSLTSLLRAAGSIILALTVLGQVTLASPAAKVSIAQVLPSTNSPARSLYFPATGKSTSGEFLKTYERFGLERIGYPLSDEQQENGRTVQYFERVKMEAHPETASQGYSVLMSRLGADLTQGTHFNQVQAFQSNATRIYVAQTGHSLSEPFLSHWKANGGLELFGYPISEPFSQGSLTVQWFERARFEYHPEMKDSGNAIQLSLLGQTAYQNAAGAQQAKPQAPSAPPQPTLAPNESWMVQAINQQRAAAGVQPVQISSALTDLSRARSTDMAQRDYFSHTTPEGKNFLGMLGERHIKYQYAGEILARNNAPEADAAVTALNGYLGSAPHKAILLDGRFTQVGVGYSTSADGMHYFTVIFVQP